MRVRVFVRPLFDRVDEQCPGPPSSLIDRHVLNSDTVAMQIERRVQDGHRVLRRPLSVCQQVTTNERRLMVVEGEHQQQQQQQQQLPPQHSSGQRSSSGRTGVSKGV
jgi:hypothetical protein